MRTPRFAELYDCRWLRQRVEAGATADTLAAELGCGAGTARAALRRYGLQTRSNPQRRGEPPPRKLGDAATALADLDADVDAAELSERLREGMRDLAKLADVAHRVSRDQTWDLVVGIDAATARSIAFSAAMLASEQRKPGAPGPGT